MKCRFMICALYVAINQLLFFFKNIIIIMIIIITTTIISLINNLLHVWIYGVLVVVCRNSKYHYIHFNHPNHT